MGHDYLPGFGLRNSLCMGSEQHQQPLYRCSLRLEFVGREIAIEIAIMIDDHWRIRGIWIPRAVVAVARTVGAIRIPYASVGILAPVAAILVKDRVAVVLVAIYATKKNSMPFASEQKQCA